jgi:hypothetical protein
MALPEASVGIQHHFEVTVYYTIDVATCRGAEVTYPVSHWEEIARANNETA